VRKFIFLQSWELLCFLISSFSQSHEMLSLFCSLEFGHKILDKINPKYIDKSKTFHISFHLYIWYTLEICGANLTFTVCMGLLGSCVSLFLYFIAAYFSFSFDFLIWHQVIYLFECFLRLQDFIRHKNISIIYDCCKDYQNSRIWLWIENKNYFLF
jgi:hypothetical protein